MPLYLTEADVEALLSPADAVDAVEARSGASRPARSRTGRATGSASTKAGSPSWRRRTSSSATPAPRSTAPSRPGRGFCVLLFDARAPELHAVIEADALGRLRTGGGERRRRAAPRARGRGLARRDRLRLAGARAGRRHPRRRAGHRARRRLVPHAGASRSVLRRAPAPSRARAPRDAAEQDVVVTVTTSRDPVLRGEWLGPGALVCAVGANDGRSRELDNVVLERAVFVCCDSIEQARIESADLIEPVEGGVLDWLEVHELHEVVAGEVARPRVGRRHRRLQVERARGVGRRRRCRRLRARPRARSRDREL